LTLRPIQGTTSCLLRCLRTSYSAGCQLEHVQMPLGQVLYEPGSVLSHVYFPTTAIISLLYVMQNGESAEIAVVGNEGVIGVSLFMGGDSTSSNSQRHSC
jgi:hypothetical protein